jgi:hypothetical protein
MFRPITAKLLPRIKKEVKITFDNDAIYVAAMCMMMSQ